MSMTAKQINLKSEALGRQSVKLQEQIHEHAIVIINHIKVHGDVTVADTLVNAIAGSIRKNALRSWFIAYGGCTWNADKECFRKAKDFTFDIEAATAEPFWLFEPEPKFKPVDFNALLKAALAKAKKALADEEHKNEHDVNPELVAAIEALVK